MAAPEFVPLAPTDRPRAYHSPPRRPESWVAERPGEVVDGGQPRADRLGSPGPDQGYVYKLVRRFEGQIHLAEGEHHEDAEVGCIAVALKRASLFGRAPVIHDLTVAFTVWGFLDDPVAAELAEARQPLFAEVRHPVHYLLQRAIADAVPASTLRLTPAAAAEAHTANWRDLLDL